MQPNNRGAPHINCFGLLSNQLPLIIFSIFFPTKLTSMENTNDWGPKSEVISSFQYFGHHCLQYNCSYNYVLESWNLHSWVQWNPKVHDSVETGIKLLAWLLAFCVNLDHRMRHPVSLCFNSFKYDGENSPQKTQDNGGWQEGSSPAPGPAPAQSILSCGLRPACSGLHPVRVWNPPGDSPTSLGPRPTAGLSSWGEGFSLSPAWVSHLSFCAAASHPLTTHHREEPTCIFSIPSYQCGGCCCVLLKLSLLPAEPALLPQPLLAGQGCQPHHLGDISSPPTSSVYIETVAWQLM